MRSDVVTVDKEVSVTEASLNMRKKGQGCAIVLEQGKPFGIITEQDVTWKVAGNGLDPKNVKVSEIMSTPLITIDPGMDLVDAAKIMAKNKIRRLAVISNGVLLGVLTAANISRHLENYMDQEARNILKYTWMPRYSTEDVS